MSSDGAKMWCVKAPGLLSQAGDRPVTRATGSARRRRRRADCGGRRRCAPGRGAAGAVVAVMLIVEALDQVEDALAQILRPVVLGQDLVHVQAGASRRLGKCLARFGPQLRASKACLPPNQRSV